MKSYPVILYRCPICGVEIFKFNGKAVVYLPNQVQFPVYLTDGGTVDIGMCLNCMDSCTDEQVRAVFEGIKEYWEDEGYKSDQEIRCILKELAWNRELADGSVILVRP